MLVSRSSVKRGAARSLISDAVIGLWKRLHGLPSVSICYDMRAGVLLTGDTGHANLRNRLRNCMVVASSDHLIDAISVLAKNIYSILKNTLIRPNIIICKGV